ncbi:TetR/AcrR family transcriptional regulator [Granulicella sp. L60]|uniref:TetR/AcrR family transcriptional regulator n=1 Tax=Granulicella sp. L60 TaxID=1641866 RepID=UPI00131B2C04|nr:TetR/AcrR family transcriptional regulator [Granulicella sp. L60]
MQSAKTSGKITKHQVKTEATLRVLLDAAETIFVRDGYERAQIETIASEAGRTKGAIYAHFRSKEDIFFALLEQKAASRGDEFLKATKNETFERKMEAIKEIFLNAVEDENWPILMLEFKLFALRNKDSLQRVRDLYQLLYANIGRHLLVQAESSTKKDRDKMQIGIAILRSIPSSIALEKQFSSVLNSSALTRDVLGDVFDSLMNIRHKQRKLRSEKRSVPRRSQ